MSLPPLPRVLRKREADITTRRVSSFIKEKFPNQDICFEVKVRGRKVEEHQMYELKKAQESGYYKKFKDDGSRQDFDGIWMPHPVSIIIWIEKDSSLTIETVTP